MARKSVLVEDFVEVDRPYINKHLDMAMSDLTKAASRAQKLQEKYMKKSATDFESLKSAIFSVETRMRSMRNYIEELPSCETDDIPSDEYYTEMQSKRLSVDDADHSGASTPKKMCKGDATSNNQDMSPAEDTNKNKNTVQNK